MYEVPGYHCQRVESVSPSQSSSLVYRLNMSQVTQLWIVLLSAFILVTDVGGLDEVVTLMMVPSGGRYDPGELWDADIADLVGVNDCIDDETLSLTDLALKGTYRNSRRFNMTEYLNPRLQFFVYDQQEAALIQLEECPFADTVSCAFGSNTVTNGKIAENDGYKLITASTTNTLVAVFNPRRYLDEAPDGIKILISETLAALPEPGYIGCKSVPSGTPATLTENSMSRCYTECALFNYFALSQTNCHCVNDIGSLTVATSCTELCPGENEQLCGGTSAASVFDRTEYTSFVDFFDALTNATLRSAVDMTDDGAQKTIAMSTGEYISAAMVEVEEECQLTNLYFDTPPVEFTLQYSTTDCSSAPVYHTTLMGSGELEYFDSVKAKCVFLVAESFNYTYPRARISVYGPDGPTVDVAGMFVIKGIFEIPESSSLVPSSSMDLDMSSSEAMLMPSTSMDFPLIDDMSTSDMVNMAASTEASIDDMIPSDMTNIPANTEATPTMSDQLAPTAAVSPTEATIHPTGSVTSASASVDPGATTTTPSTGVSTTTTKTIYSKDGRIIFESCTCVCKLPPLKANQTRLEQAVEKGQELSEELQVNTKNLSASIRKKESAPDDRQSASAGGYAAIILLTLIGVLFIAADVLSIAGHIQMLKSNLSSAFGKA